MKMGSWTYNKANLDLEPSDKYSQKLDLEYFQNKRIDVIDSDIFKEEKSYDCCPDEIYPSITYSIKFKMNSKVGKKGEILTP